MSHKSPYKHEGMFAGANHLVFELAKDLRRSMNGAENILWLHLKGGFKGLKFRRQHPLSIYIADFYCHKIKLVIEVDGSIHNKPEVKEYDEKRQKDLVECGCNVIRFTNKEIITDISTV
jgi:imidazole glycerol-phosphate synthase subunit HisF